MLGTCTAHGEIDIATAPALRVELFDCIEHADDALINVDCAGVTFMDSAGYHVLVAATEFAALRGHTLVIRNLPPACGRVIRMCNLDRELNVEPMPMARSQTGAGRK